jgi:hypothetical protein
MINYLKDIPVKAVPYVIFLAGCAVFGEIFVRTTVTNTTQYIVSLLMGVCTIATAGLFFTKLLVNWPRLPGLDLTNGRRR